MKIPRTARKKSQTGIYHIMLRGINKQAIFEDDDDRTRFLKILQRYRELTGFHLYAYCLMNNHVHLLIKEQSEGISTTVKRISSSYVTYYNKKHDRTGHLFQERFKSEPVDDQDYFLIVQRYIHQNPLKAGMVGSVEDYQWSSYNDYLHQAKRIDPETTWMLFEQFARGARQEFIEYNNLQNNDECLDIKRNKKLGDTQAKTIILEMACIEDIEDIRKLDRMSRKIVLKQIKNIPEISLRQIQRITGLSYNLIRKA